MKRIVRHVSPAWQLPGDEAPGTYVLEKVEVLFNLTDRQGIKESPERLMELLSSEVFKCDGDTLICSTIPERLEHHIAVAEACAEKVGLTLLEDYREFQWHHTP